MAALRVGTSGYAYPAWRGAFYAYLKHEDAAKGPAYARALLAAG